MKKITACFITLVLLITNMLGVNAEPSKPKVLFDRDKVSTALNYERAWRQSGCFWCSPGDSVSKMSGRYSIIVETYFSVFGKSPVKGFKSEIPPLYDRLVSAYAIIDEAVDETSEVRMDGKVKAKLEEQVSEVSGFIYEGFLEKYFVGNPSDKRIFVDECCRNFLIGTGAFDKKVGSDRSKAHKKGVDELLSKIYKEQKHGAEFLGRTTPNGITYNDLLVDIHNLNSIVFQLYSLLHEEAWKGNNILVIARDGGYIRGYTFWPRLGASMAAWFGSLPKGDVIVEFQKLDGLRDVYADADKDFSELRKRLEMLILSRVNYVRLQNVISEERRSAEAEDVRKAKEILGRVEKSLTDLAKDKKGAKALKEIIDALKEYQKSVNAKDEEAIRYLHDRMISTTVDVQQQIAVLQNEIADVRALADGLNKRMNESRDGTTKIWDDRLIADYKKLNAFWRWHLRQMYPHIQFPEKKSSTEWVTPEAKK